MTKAISQLVLLSIILCFWTQAKGETDSGLVGCGGFVSISTDLAKLLKNKIDYSNIKTKLVTADGIVKDSTDCAPNGYYFLPIYERDKARNKGSLKIQVEPPKGWSVEPTEIGIFVGDDGQCHPVSPIGDIQSTINDINFLLSGFTLYGQVDAQGSCKKGAGPQGVTVALYSPDQSSPIQTVITDNKGRYVFQNIFPGDYVIKASHQTWEFAKDTVKVSLTVGNSEVSEHFLISGYDIVGSVKMTNEPVQGVQFRLYSKESTQIPCKSNLDKSSLHGDSSALCAATSDEKGEFRFLNIPCGNYTISPSYKVGDVKFDVVPEIIHANVNQGSVSLLDKFEVSGFSVIGRVVDSQGAGIAGATIQLNGITKTSTDTNGYFTLAQVQGGTYNIIALKEHINFEPLETTISPKTQKLPNIVAKSFDVCGLVQLIGPSSSQIYIGVFDVNDQLLQKRTTTKVPSKSADEYQYQFCAALYPGSFFLKPISDDSNVLLSLSPSKLEIQVTNTPILDLNFAQTRVNVSGVVLCAGQMCDSDTAANGEPISSFEIQLSSKSGGSTRRTPVVAKKVDGKWEYRFEFLQVMPGHYTVSPASIESHPTWCWKQQSVDIKVGNSNLFNIVLEQIGYQTVVELSHAHISLDFVLQKDTNVIEKFSDLAAGVNKFCIKHKGVYSVKPTASVSCFKFEKDAYQQDVGSPNTQPLVINVDKFQATGKFSVRASSSQPFNPKEFQVQVTRAINTPNSETFFAHIENLGERNGTHDLQYNFWSRTNEQYIIKPVAAADTNVLFYPEESTFDMMDKNCVNNLPAFEGRAGLFLDGNISPPVENARVIVYAYHGTKQDAKMLIETTTKKDGRFSVGPLHDDKSYYVDLSKSGYNFQKVDDFNFKAIKLGQIAVKVTDTTGQLVSGVLLSLSGDSYRSNNMTSNSPFVFENLNPGDYYLRPLLKEYVFEPTSKGISITEGSEVVVSLTAKRIAFSCFGTVRSLNGDAERSVTVEAVPVSTDGATEREEAQTESNGAFRIRGLVPGKSYTISVKADKATIDRAFPQEIVVDVENKDIQDAQFVIFKKTNKHDISGIVDIPEALALSSVTVTLWRIDTEESLIRTVDLGINNFFEFQKIPAGVYEVRVSSSLPSSIYNIPNLKQRVNLESNTHLKLRFDISMRVATDEELSNTPIFTLFFGVIVLATIYYFNELTVLAENISSGKLKLQINSPPQATGVASIQDSAADWLPKGLKTKHKKK